MNTCTGKRRAAALTFVWILAAAPVAHGQAGTVQAPTRTRAVPEHLDPAVKFLSPYGLSNFSAHYVDALSALLRAQQQYDAGHFAKAKGILDGLWANHPTGGLDWGGLPTKPFGINIGSPPAYCGLRMLSDTVNWRVANPGSGPALRKARLTVVLVGKSNGVEPQNLQDLTQGTGVHVNHALEPLLLANDSKVVHDSLHLFREYVVAMTEGALEIETHVLHLPDLDMPVHAKTFGGTPYAGLVDASQLWWSVPTADIEATDWWWILYPSHVPEQHPDFQSAEFITGGMGTGPDSESPFFIIDDRWLVRKPPHLGSGPYTDVEREVYLPQWLQHEFFHHLYRTFPEFGLESTPHQWFNPATWPPDFAGRYEADYYHESLYKRLQTATTTLVSALRYATADAPWHLFSLGDVLGNYKRLPVQNSWHVGSIQFGPQLEWQNQANVDWNLQDKLASGDLLTGPDCPYFGSWAGSKFDVVLARDALGDFLPRILGFAFNGELYTRVGP